MAVPGTGVNLGGGGGGAQAGCLIPCEKVPHEAGAIKPRSKLEADQLLEKHRWYTLGKAIKIGDKAGLYPESLQQELKEFLSERNWLIHRSIAQGRDDWDSNISRGKLIRRIKAITTQAQGLLQLIEEDLIEFSEANGVDMSRVRAEINMHYFE